MAAYRAGDTERTAGLLAIAGKWPETEVFKRLNDPNVPVSWLDHLILPTQRGDFTNIIAQVDARAAA